MDVLFGDLLNRITTQSAELALPILTASVLILLGILIGWLLKVAVVNILEYLNLGRVVDKAGLSKVVGAKVSWTALLGDIVEWFVIIAFLIKALNLVQLDEVSTFVSRLLGYLPNVFAAVVIVLVGSVVADLFARFVVNTAHTLRVKTADFLGDAARVVVTIFAVLIAASQLSSAVGEFLHTLFQALVWMVAGSVILAFGFGGQQAASDFIDRFRKQLKK